jgi:hypothetical protein
MTEGNSQDTFEMEDLLRRMEEARQALMEAINSTDPDLFEAEAGDSESIKRALERTSDELNFYYGMLAARALSLPQPPCMQKAGFGSLREAAMSLQVAHRRFSNLLHDLTPPDLERTANDENGGTYTVRQMLEMASAQYNYRAQQIQRIAEQVSPRS